MELTSGPGRRAFDVIVVGCGAMGAAACMHVARRGKRVLGIERFTRGHAFGSSHGHSRIIRQAYFEHSDYVPLLKRACELFAALERDANEKLVMRCGVLLLGRTDSEVIVGSERSAQSHDIPYEMLDRRDVALRFPQFAVDDDHVGVWEPGAGIVRPEATILAQLRLAEAAGATILEETQVLDFRCDGDGVVVETSRGPQRGDCVIVCAGPWSAALVGSNAKHLRVTRQPVVWCEPDEGQAAAHTAPTLPVWLVDHHDGTAIYGIPMHPGLGGPRGVKAALHGGGVTADPNNIDRNASAMEIEATRSALARALPKAARNVIATSVCMYTYTPDAHFIVERDESRRAIVACGFSGHGFKFAPVLGEALADLALAGSTRQPIDFLSSKRLEV